MIKCLRVTNSEYNIAQLGEHFSSTKTNFVCFVSPESDRLDLRIFNTSIQKVVRKQKNKIKCTDEVTENNKSNEYSTVCVWCRPTSLFPVLIFLLLKKDVIYTYRAISINFSSWEIRSFRRNRHRRYRPGRNSARRARPASGHLNEPKRRARVCRAACGTRVSCRRCIPHARGRAIKRMQIKTFYLNDNITLVDASALA